MTGIGSTVNEVDLKGVDEAWAQPLVQQKFMESQAQSQPLLSISLESEMMKENDDLISYECRKAVHKDPFESDFDDAMDDGFDDYQDYDQLNGDWCHDDDRYIVDQYHEEIMSSPGVYKSLPKQYGDYEIRSDPIYHDTELEIVDYVDVYEPVFVQPVYYEEYHQVEEYHSGYSAHPVHYDNHSRKQYQERISDRTRDGQAKDSQSQMPKKQISKPKVKIPNNESSEDDLLL